jgi:hypothetical protein
MRQNAILQFADLEIRQFNDAELHTMAVSAIFNDREGKSCLPKTIRENINILPYVTSLMKPVN